jgi:hypothetical protein
MKLNTVKNGKGDKPRPFSDYEKYINNFDDIFKKKKTKKDLENLKQNNDTK